ncbi:MAG: helix-turn-helix domain-containing protein, partial [archaeon]|nr:helix-turn-helix domain-containing protein [archaeon]
MLSSQGFDLETLTEVVKASKSTIRNWFNAFEVEGIPSLARKKGSGAPHKLPTAFCESLESLLEKAPRVTADFESDRGRWTLSELKRYVNEHYQVK